MVNRLRAGHGQRALACAHRGFSAAAPENTLAALRAAIAIGADFAEIDVRLTRDGELVLMHDRSVDRTTDGRGLVAELSLAELRQLDAGGSFADGFVGEPIPTLGEALALCRDRLTLLIEMKNYPDRDPRFVDRLIAAVEESTAVEWAVPAGFDHPTLAELHRHRPDWPLETIYHCRLCDTAAAARACGATLVSMEPEFCVDSDVTVLHVADIAVLTTVLSPEHGRLLRAIGVDVLEADDAALAVAAAHA